MKFRLMIVVLLVAAAGASFAAGEKPRVSLKISSNRDEYVVGEPVVVRVEVTNVTNEDVAVCTNMDADCSLLKFYFKNPKGEKYEFEWFILADTELGTMTLKAGESLEYNRVFLCHTGGMIFPSPGKYEINASFRYDLDREAVVSKAISVKVVPAQDAETAFADEETARFLVEFSSDKKTIAKLERFLETSPKSRFAPFIMCSLAKLKLSEDRMKEGWKETRMGAEKMLHDVMTDFPDFPLDARVRLIAAYGYYDMQMQLKAIDEFQELIKKHPKSLEGRLAEAYLDTLKAK